MNGMEFNADTHEYTHNNQKYTSVTQLLKKYNLSANYDNIPQDVLTKAANRGKAAHNSLEAYVKGDRSELNITSEVDLLHTYVTTRGIDLSTASSEQLVFNDTYKIAGTIDFQYTDGIDRVIADFKTTSTLHLDAVSWQLSIYNYILCNGDLMTYYFNKIKVFHYTTSKLYVKDVYLVDYDQVEALLKANLNNEPTFNYVKSSSVVSGSDEQLIAQVLREITSHKEIVDKLENELDLLLEKVKERMVQSNDYSYSNSEYSLHYVSPQQRSTFDTHKAKEFITSSGQDIDSFMKQSVTKDGIKAVLRNK
jgi:uncharacterized coiled-coil protein SlyX